MIPRNLAATDLRGLDPPEPLLRILAALEEGTAEAHAFLLGREPLPLYPLLAAAGWRHQVRHGPEGVDLLVFREERRARTPPGRPAP